MALAIASVLGIGGAAYLGVKTLAPWLIEDIRFLKKFKIALNQYYAKAKDEIFFIDLFEETVKNCPDKVMLLYEDQSYTYQEVNERANKVGHTLLNEGLKKGDVIALMMQNVPEFIWIYLGKSESILYFTE